MESYGITYARAKNGIALFVLGLLSAIPALSQANFASQKNTGHSKYRNESALLNSYSFSGPAEQPYRSLTPSVRNYFPVNNFSSNGDISYANPIEPKKETVIEEKNREISVSDIRFKPKSFTYPANSKADIGITKYSADQLILYAKVLKQYAKKNGFDTNYAFLSNMGIRCNKKRFFVVNLATMEIEQSGLVAHGRGQGPSVYDRQYSNQNGSKCTSLGRYKISGKYKGGYGEAYKMVGLDSTNHNAYMRNIVLHSMGCIPDTDGAMPACVSEGCPAVSTNFMGSLRSIIDSRKKPVLLWIFDSNLEEAVVQEKTDNNGSGHVCSVHKYKHDVAGLD